MARYDQRLGSYVWDGVSTDPNTGQPIDIEITSGSTGSAKFDVHAGTCPDGGVANKKYVEFYNEPPTFNTETLTRTTSGQSDYSAVIGNWDNYNPIWPTKVPVPGTRDAEIAELKAQVKGLKEEVLSLTQWIHRIRQTALGY